LFEHISLGFECLVGGLLLVDINVNSNRTDRVAIGIPFNNGSDSADPLPVAACGFYSVFRIVVFSCLLLVVFKCCFDSLSIIWVGSTLPGTEMWLDVVNWVAEH